MGSILQAQKALQAQKTTKKPWEYFGGFSRAGWYRLMSAGLAPLPLQLPGVRNVWRTCDLDAWLEKQRPVRGLRRRPGTGNEATAEAVMAG